MEDFEGNDHSGTNTFSKSVERMWYLFCLDRFIEWGILHRSTDEVTWNRAYKKAWSLAQRLFPPSWQLAEFCLYQTVGSTKLVLDPPYSSHLALSYFGSFQNKDLPWKDKISWHLRHSENLAAALKIIPKEELHECSSSGSTPWQSL